MGTPLLTPQPREGSRQTKATVPGQVVVFIASCFVLCVPGCRVLAECRDYCCKPFVTVESKQRTMAEAAEVASLDRVLTRLALTEEDSLEKACRHHVVSAHVDVHHQDSMLVVHY